MKSILILIKITLDWCMGHLSNFKAGIFWVFYFFHCTENARFATGTQKSSLSQKQTLSSLAPSGNGSLNCATSTPSPAVLARTRRACVPSFYSWSRAQFPSSINATTSPLHSMYIVIICYYICRYYKLIRTNSIFNLNLCICNLMLI